MLIMPEARLGTTSPSVWKLQRLLSQVSGWYKKNGLEERPLVEGAKVHGKTLDPFMDFYPEQYEALKALMKAVHEATGIPLKAPLDRSGNTNTTVSKKCADGQILKGFISHYHLKKGKIDCANLDLKTILET